MGGSAPDRGFFLPDLCHLPVLFTVILLSELFALIVSLTPLTPDHDFWNDLALSSLFIQWVALTGAGLLSLLRPALRRLGTPAAALVAWLLLLLLVALFSRLTVRFADVAGLSLPVEGQFLLRNLAIGSIVSAIVLRYFYLQHQWKQRLRTESEARVQALQARIRPHFLFNSMNTIASLTRSAPEAAEAAIEDLADLFRASLGEGRRLIPLQEELELCRRYLHIEGLRLGERLRVAWGSDPFPDEALIPPLTLQPLIENAVCHGIEPLPQGGAIAVTGSSDGEFIELCVENPSGASSRRGAGMALDNIRERLALHYGGRASLVRQVEGGVYRVTLKLPHLRSRS